MKKWEKPVLNKLGVEDTQNDSSVGHYCHREENYACSDFTNGKHNSMGDPHTEPSWKETCEGFQDPLYGSGHTCCCPGLS